MSAPPIPIPDNIEVSAGPLLLGYLFNWALYGVLSVQVYIYYMAFPTDRLPVKALVFGLFAIETTQTILVVHDAFNGYAIGFGDLRILGSAQMEWLAVPIFSGIVSCTVQMFFAYRITKLSKSVIPGLVISAIALTQGVSAIVQGVQAFIIGNFAQLQQKAFVSCTIWLAGSALCDIIIAVAMVFYLSRSNTTFKQTQMFLNKLIRLTIESGTLTATIATVDIVLFLAYPNNNFHACPALTLGKLYTNTLLVILNSRVRILGGRDDSQVTELSEFNSLASTATKRRTFGNRSQPGLASLQRPMDGNRPPNFISIQRSVVTDRGDGDEFSPKMGYGHDLA